jgi:hypothetical protein
MLASRCHTGSPVRASYTAGDGYVELACTRCGKLVARIAVAGAVAEAPVVEKVNPRETPAVQQIDAIWAYLTSGPDGEAIIASLVRDVVSPLVAVVYRHAEALRPFAQAVAGAAPRGTVVRLVKFRQREELEVIEP